LIRFPWRPEMIGSMISPRESTSLPRRKSLMVN
jgi:hypothetical protein